MSPTHEELRAAVARLRDAGFAEDAEDLDGILTAAWTSSSELLGEIGIRVVRILRAHRSEIPPDVRHVFEAMLTEVENTWPGIRSLP